MNDEREHQRATSSRRSPAAAAQLPLLTPSRDLWSGIEARIEARVVALPVETHRTGAGAAFRGGALRPRRRCSSPQPRASRIPS